jgi:hypothetical protein
MVALRNGHNNLTNTTGIFLGFFKFQTNLGLGLQRGSMSEMTHRP